MDVMISKNSGDDIEFDDCSEVDYGIEYTLSQ